MRFKLQVISQNFALIGIDASGHDHKSALIYARDKIDELNKGRTLSKFGILTGNECRELLLNSSIVTIRSHGTLVVNNDGTTYSTCILLNTNPQVILSGLSFPNMPSDSTDLSSGPSYDNLNLAMFVGCYTGASTGSDGKGTRNLPTIAVERGAKVAIGFKDKIICQEANKWTEAFYDYLLQGKNINECIAHANQSIPKDSSMLNITVAGNEYYHYVP